MVKAPHFDGETYDPKQDHARLTTQNKRVKSAMAGGRWRTLAEIATITKDPEASIAARLRDLRKHRFGGWAVDSRRRKDGGGLHEYRMRPRTLADPARRGSNKDQIIETQRKEIARLQDFIGQLESKLRDARGPALTGDRQIGLFS